MSEVLAESPLAEVVRDRRINGILESIRQAVRQHQPILIEPRDVDYMRRSFQKGISLGETKLREFSNSLLHHFAPNSPVQVTLFVWGRCPGEHSSEIVINEVDLTNRTDILTTFSDTQISEPNTPVCPICKSKTRVIASFVRHQPELKPDSTFQTLWTRIKTTSNICYKVADMVFDIDSMFRRDKIFNVFGQVVADVYGVKVVVKDRSHISAIVEYFRRLDGVIVVEEKDYTGQRKKKSGYEAYKIAIKRDRQLIEIQIQCLEMFENERSSRSASHKTYKERQMAERAKLGREYVELYRALSELLKAPEENYCSIDYIEIGQSTKGMDDEF